VLRADATGGPLIRPATPEDTAAVVDLVVEAGMFSELRLWEILRSLQHLVAHKQPQR